MRLLLTYYTHHKSQHNFTGHQMHSHNSFQNFWYKQTVKTYNSAFMYKSTQISTNPLTLLNYPPPPYYAPTKTKQNSKKQKTKKQTNKKTKNQPPPKKNQQQKTSNHVSKQASKPVPKQPTNKEKKKNPTPHKQYKRKKKIHITALLSLRKSLVFVASRDN